MLTHTIASDHRITTTTFTVNMVIEMTRAQELSERRRKLGKKASFARLARRINKRQAAMEEGGKRISATSIYRTLAEQPSGIEMDRDRIMNEVELALNEIEREVQGE